MSLWLTHPLFLPSLIVGVTIVLWATSLLPEFITALLFFAAAMMAKIAPPEVIFGGFASSAFWLVFSGFVLGIAIRKTGLADRAAQALSARLTDSWPRMVASVVLLSYALAFVMPSNMGRIALLMPIVAAMARRAGIADGSRGWFGLALAVGFGTFQLSATILPANVPNLVMSGAAEGSYGIHLNYVPYLLLHTPVLGWLKGGGAGGADLLAVSRQAASTARPGAAAADEPRRETSGVAAGGGPLAMGDRELARRRPGVDRPGGGCDHAAAAGGLY